MNKNGVGLGLVISERIVRQLGGDIGFSSKPAPEEGHGSTFYFTMRLDIPQNDSDSEDLKESPYKLNGESFSFKWSPQENS
mmetsp:Transcript_17583/g.27191  ORF Transcript_17583/g.27191 Transcript_17583/m.27191 type:complete len:81 (+) Transcript_17583:179-421(+)